MRNIQKMLNKEEILIISDTNERDGMGMEVWKNDKLILEIFTDDSKKTRTITFYEKEIPFEDMERYMIRYKKDLWEFENE
ncbi:hypothetical protein [Christiangramia sabulilitoris]|uniref:Uncharacterized protein n=1 Tax=Christiangramia sabulilitoris TaxID=2583991 RepID=A0A550I756_9FLAO|nr:hypothetical protein [Christiangramia sabulilitoris]TRO66807.1 hypothetical protein FGM01_02635 [Christiangramia sabulilitoris]